MTSLLDADAKAEVSENTTVRQRSLFDGAAAIETLLSHPTSPFDNIELDSSANIQQATLDVLREEASLAELIEKSPDDVLTVLREMAVAKFGTFTAKDSHVLKAFGNFPMLTRGCETADDPYWKENWKDIIEDRAKPLICSKQCDVGWEQTVTLGAYVAHFKDIGKREHGDLIKLLLQKTSAGAAPKDVWEIPVVRAVINYHWQQWANRLYNLIFFVFLLWVIAFGGYLTLYIQSTKIIPESSVPEGHSSHQQANETDLSAGEHLPVSNRIHGGRDENGRYYGSFSSKPEIALLTWVFVLVCFGCMLPFGIEEYYTVVSQGRYWFHLRNVFDLLTNSLQVVIFACTLIDMGLTNDWFGVLLAIQTVLLYIRLLRFVRILGEGTTFFDTAIAVIYDVRYWLVYIIFTGVCASFCFGALYKTDEEFHFEHRAFRSVENSLVTTFQIVFGSFTSEYIFDAHFHWLNFLLFFAFQILMTVTVLNLLIAAMSGSYANLEKEKNIRYYRGRAVVIDELSGLKLPDWLVKKVDSYIHFIIVETPTRRTPLAASSAEDKQASVEELRNEVRDISAKLDRLLAAMNLTGPSPATSHSLT